MNLCYSSAMMTAMQCRAARGLIDWTQDRLAIEAGVSAFTVRNFEGGKTEPTRATLEVIRRAFEKAGITFIDGDEPGVKLIKNAKGAEEISRQIDALEDKISSMPAPTEPSPEAGMNIMRKAVAKNDLAKLKNRRTRITRRDRSK